MGTIIEITDYNQPELDIYARMTENQLKNRLHAEQGIFIAESPKVIRVALQAGCRPVSLLMERRHLSGQGAEVIAACGNVPVYTGEREILAKLTGYELTRGILCAMQRPAALAVEQVCGGARRIGILEDIVDATNIGAIFRSAAALGMDGILLTPHCGDPLLRRAVRVSMGTVFQIPWARLEGSWPTEGMTQLRDLGFKTAAMALDDRSVSIEDERLAKEEKLAILLGTEGDGLSAQTIAECDYTVKIPMYHQVDSLNVAAASAVAFWELRAR